MNPPDETGAVAPEPGRSELDGLDASGRRRQQIALVASGVLIVGIIAVVLLALTSSSPEEAEVVDGELRGLDGETFELAELRGQPVVVNFFASWCAPCRDELPAFELVSRDLAGQVTFVTVNTGESDEAAARELLVDSGITFRVGFDDDGSLIEAVDGLVMPTTAFLDADGRLVRTHLGALDADELSALVEDELLTRA